MNDVDAFREQIRRPAILMEIGGFRPPESLLASWFGRVNVAAPAEGWPQSHGQPMLALAQINVVELPFRPPRMEDIEFVTIFVGRDELPMNEPNGVNWCLRAYHDRSVLVPLQAPGEASPITPLPMRPALVEDYPCHDDLPGDLPAEIEEDYEDLFQNQSGFKLGGWPSLIQSEIYWAPYQAHPAKPEYVFQIDTTEKGRWMWGDSGCGYFGRGTAPGHENEWALEWQCF